MWRLWRLSGCVRFWFMAAAAITQAMNESGWTGRFTADLTDEHALAIAEHVLVQKMNAAMCEC
jgi:hypothetical protein